MSTSRKTNLGFLLASIFIFVVIFVSVLSTDMFIGSAKWVAHTVEVRTQVDRLYSLYLVAQNNVRGFHLTEQEYYLKQYRSAIDEIPIATQRLRELTGDNGDQQKEPLVFRRAGFSPALSLLMSAFALLIPPACLTAHLHRLSGREYLVPSPEFSQAPWYSLPDHLCRFGVRFDVT